MLKEDKYTANAARLFARALMDIEQDEECGEEERAAKIQIVVDLLADALANSVDLRNEALDAAAEAVVEKMITKEQFQRIWGLAKL